MRPAAQAADLPPCQQGGQACVVITVEGAGGQPRSTTFSADQVVGPDADVRDSSYDGGVSVSDGSSVRRLMDLAGVDYDTVTFVEVDAPALTDSYGRHLLTTGDVGTTGDGAPTFYLDQAQRMNFVRDSRGSGDDPGPPGPDQGRLLSDVGGALQVVVHTSGQALTDVSATATAVGGSDRTFTLSCARCAGLTTTWYFPDGTTSGETSPTYTFPSIKPAGSYLFAVAVENPSDGSFGWGQTGARIGPAPTPTPAASATGSGGNGRDHHGATRGSKHSDGPGSGTGHGGSASASPSASSTGTATTSPSPQPTLSIPASSGGPLSVPTVRPPKPTPTVTATPTMTPTDLAAGGTTVSGVLLADAQAVPVAPSAGADVRDDVPQPSEAAAPIVDRPFGIDPLVWMGVGTALLLAAGAVSENDRVRQAMSTRLRRWARIGG